MRFAVLLLFLYFSLPGDQQQVLGGSNKYTKDAEKSDGDPTKNSQFRVQKLNFIWSKATRKLTDSTDQQLLLQQLKKLDKQLLAAKYERDDGRDADGILSKELEKELETLLNKFRLSDVYESLKYGAGGGGATKNDGGGKSNSNSEPFKDQKLRRLWMDAVAAGEFDDAELAALETEFRHHQNKLEEYSSMASDHFSNNVDESSSTKRKAHHHKQNSVLFDHDDDDDAAKSKNAELKRKFKQIQSDYDSLKRKVADKVQSTKQEDEESTKSINHPRVVPLLEKARALYSGQELASIEEELRHFQTRLNKLEYLKAEERSASTGKSSSPDDGPTKKTKKEKAPIIYDPREVSEHLSQYSRKVDKYEKYLASKLEL